MTLCSAVSAWGELDPGGLETGAVSLWALDDLYTSSDDRYFFGNQHEVHVTVTRGQPHGRAFLFVIEFDHTPFFRPLLASVFDTVGEVHLRANRPPEVIGHTVTLQSLGIGPFGDVRLSNLETIKFE